MFPEWLPNLHPLVVHLPIGILVAAVLVDLVAVFWRKANNLTLAAVVLYALGALGTLFAYLTGQQAAETVEVPTAAVGTMARHEDLALYTLLFFSVYAVIRVGIYAVYRHPGWLPSLALWLVAAGGLVLLWQTSERGGELVYAHGVGVSPVTEMSAELEALRREAQAAQAEPVFDDAGGWSWRITEGADFALEEHFEWLLGDPEGLEARVVQDEAEESFLELQLENGPFLFVAGSAIQDVEIRAELNADDFDGRLALVHNAHDAANYHFWEKRGDEFVQGLIEDEQGEVLDGGEHAVTGWFTTRATGAAGHFYGYVNGETIAHGHTDTPEAGQTGLFLEGNGTLKIRSVHVEAID